MKINHNDDTKEIKNILLQKKTNIKQIIANNIIYKIYSNVSESDA